MYSKIPDLNVGTAESKSWFLKRLRHFWFGRRHVSMCRASSSVAECLEEPLGLCDCWVIHEWLWWGDMDWLHIEWPQSVRKKILARLVVIFPHASVNISLQTSPHIFSNIYKAQNVVVYLALRIVLKSLILPSLNSSLNLRRLCT